MKNKFQLKGFLSEGIQFGRNYSEGIHFEGNSSSSLQIIDFTFSRPPNSKETYNFKGNFHFLFEIEKKRNLDTIFGEKCGNGSIKFPISFTALSPSLVRSLFLWFACPNLLGLKTHTILKVRFLSKNSNLTKSYFEFLRQNWKIFLNFLFQNI